MVKQYITTLKNGAREQKAHILGRNITLKDGEVVYEGILTKTFPSLFEEIVDVSTHTEVAEAEAPAEVEAPETILTEDSSDVQGVVAEAEAEAEAPVEVEAEAEVAVEAEAEEAVITKSNSKRATKAAKAK